ncbi:G patch domain-containing protein 1-like [Asterias rubens]|uniref:G patch domain-containing protein 1-like n=1 Tax=Asterias rubens TaxID=7604 RepID=UPI001455D4E6|nr:G patch domain-containing protein 1-like [Asterias rubens]
MADDSDEDDLVTYGTSLEPIDDDAARRKPVLLEDQVVTDKQGRRRFHGAFTGGFSAGYFNSVGSKKGWEPSTFTSSRGQKSGASNQRAEDFMDDEDLGDFGIAPRKIVTTGKFTNEETRRKRPAQVVGPSVIPGESPLQDLIVPSNDSMGARLLRKMGWRHGQGIGAKVRRRKKKSALIGAPESDGSGGEESNFYQGFLFAPADVDEIAMMPKDDHHGIGYRGLDPTLAGMGRHVSLFEEPVNSRGGKRGISGQAFGIGAFEAADDEIYSSGNLANYDRVLGGEEPGKSKYGWTAPSDRQKGSPGVLENFKASGERRSANTVYPPPVLPKDFRPFHIMKASSKENQPPTTDYQSRFKLSATQRGAMLGEEELPGPSSVFDFLSPEDQQKLKSSVPTQVPTQEEGKPSSLRQRGFSQTPPSAATIVPTASNPQHSWAVGAAFKPFASNPAKQERYDKFLAKKRDGTVSDKGDEGLTEWERQKETEEFNRAASLYRPLSGLMATRFVTAKNDDNDDKVDVQAEEGGDKSEQAKAAEMKMFGKLTRDSMEWHPDSLLSKRFNIPHPYPGSTTVGLTKVKKDKFSIFNFLTVATPSAEQPPPQAAPDKNKERVGSLDRENPLDEKGSRWDKRSSLLANVGVSEGGDVSINPKASKGSEEQSKTLSTLQPLDDPDSENRPPMDLFKAIFASSSEEEESNDEDEDEEEGVAKERQGQMSNDETNGTTSKPTALSTANQHLAHVISTATSSLHAAGKRQPEVLHSTANSGSESDGYYGPQLPPPSSDPTQWVSDEVRGHREPAGLKKDTNGVRVKAKTHHKEKRRKKHDRQSTGKHKRSKDKKHKSKKKKKTKDTKVRHKGHHRSPSRSKSGHKGHRRQPALEKDYDASGDSTSSSDSS